MKLQVAGFCRGRDAGWPGAPRTDPYVQNCCIRLLPRMPGVEAQVGMGMENYPYVLLHAHRAGRSTRESGSGSGAGSPARCSPWSVAFPPCPPQMLAHPCSGTSRVLFDRPTPHRRACWPSGSRPSPTGPPHLSRRASMGLPVLARGVSMHAWGLRLRSVRRTLAMAHPPVLPSAIRNDVGTLVAIISQLNTQPACAPVNASMVALRLATHDSGSGWFATPFLCDSFIHNSTPVYPGALRTLLEVRNGLIAACPHSFQPTPTTMPPDPYAAGDYPRLWRTRQPLHRVLYRRHP